MEKQFLNFLKIYHRARFALHSEIIINLLRGESGNI